MTNVATKMLIGDRLKYIGIIVGVTFATFLMTQQLAIFVGLMVRTYSLVTDTSEPDVWVMDEKVRLIDNVRNMSGRELHRVRAVEGVEWAVPLSKGMAQMRLPNGEYEFVSIIGLDDQTLIGGPPKLLDGATIEDLRQADAMFVDIDNAKVRLNNLGPGDDVEINDMRGRVVGYAKITQSFQFIPTVYTTYTRAGQWVPGLRNTLSFVLVKAKPGVSPEQLAERIKAETGLAAYTRSGFSWKTLVMYMEMTGIPAIFGTTVALGFLVGLAVAGQTFFQFMQENVKYFGMLKAMGASNGQLVKMILTQVATVGLTGLGLGVGLTALFEPIMSLWVPENAMSLKLNWQVFTAGAVGILVILSVSALLGINRVLRIEPGVVFK